MPPRATPSLTPAGRADPDGEYLPIDPDNRPLWRVLRVLCWLLIAALIIAVAAS